MENDPVLQAIYHRRSIRKFTAEPVSLEQVHSILEAGRWGPEHALGCSCLRIGCSLAGGDPEPGRTGA